MGNLNSLLDADAHHGHDIERSSLGTFCHDCETWLEKYIEFR